MEEKNKKNKLTCRICGSFYMSFFYRFHDFDFFKCSKCEVVFIYPFPTEHDLKKYYKSFKYELGFNLEKTIRKDAIRSINNISNLIADNKNIRLLDIGCGAGFLLDEARRFSWQTLGIDSSSKAVDYAQIKLGLSVINSSFLDHNFKKEKFDVITMIQVIEHLVDPCNFIKKVCLLLKKNGILCIATPNFNSWLSYILRQEYNYLIPPEHVFYYSEKNILELLKNEFYVRKVCTYGYPDDLSRIIRKIILNEHFRQRVNIKNVKSSKLVERQKKSIKRNILDKISNSGYKFLNFNNKGSMIEVYVQKK